MIRPPPRSALFPYTTLFRSTYTATVDNAVTGSDLVLTLSNGQHITIAVGQTVGTVGREVRTADAHLQGERAQGPVLVTGNTGGNFENVATTGTVLTSVIDDADTSIVTMSTSAPGSVALSLPDALPISVDNAVTGSDLVLTLSNGQHITIAVGQTVGTV